MMTDRDPPHKPVDVPAETRHAMAALACAPYDGICASDMELRRPGKSYTVDTLKSLKEQYPDTRLYYIVGGDMLDSLPSWRGAAEIFGLAEIIAIHRQGIPWAGQAAAFLRERCGAVLTPSSRCRRGHFLYQSAGAHPGRPSHVRCAGACRGSVYLRIRSLFSTGNSIHTGRRARRVGSAGICAIPWALCERPVRLAARYGMDGPQARLAALLHGCGRDHAVEQERLEKNPPGITDTAVLQAIASDGSNLLALRQADCAGGKNRARAGLPGRRINQSVGASRSGCCVCGRRCEHRINLFRLDQIHCFRKRTVPFQSDFCNIFIFRLFPRHAPTGGFFHARRTICGLYDALIAL